MHMRFMMLLPAAALLVACDNPAPTAATAVQSVSTLSASLKAPACAFPKGFNEFGYNYCARIFNGLADGLDKNLDGKIDGNPTYANDHLVMKWNAAWDACNAAPTLENCTGAWTDNEWNGKVQGGSGEVWHYKMVWVGPCGAYGTPIADGGYCIWGDYEVIFSQGTVANQHFWDAHAKPAGYGN